MRLKNILILVAALFIVVACSSPKIVTSLKSDAETLENSGDYNAALNSWEQYFAQTPVEETTGSDYASAAKTAYNAGNNEKAVAWFDQARYKNFADAEMYETLAAIYRQKGNLSKELSALEFYSNNFGNNNATVNTRLFELYTEIDDLAKAQNYWTLLDKSAKKTETNLVQYLKVNKKLENNATADSVAHEILKINPEQFDALDWLAKKYYWAGQNRYNREMKEYEANKTRKQYNILLKELDLVTADFKKALPCLEKLWEQKPGKEYAAYFANIYARFGNEKKTEFYKNFMNR